MTIPLLLIFTIENNILFVYYIIIYGRKQSFFCFRQKYIIFFSVEKLFNFFHYTYINNPTAIGYFNNLFRCPQITTDQQCTRKFYSRMTVYRMKIEYILFSSTVGNTFNTHSAFFF